jgi:hypothetical protein
VNRTYRVQNAVVATVVLLGLVLPGCGKKTGGDGNATTDAALITNAVSAAPAAVSRQATVIAFDEQGRERTLRLGSGEFTCFPDDRATPGDDPMCFDRSGLAWAHAWMAKQPPPPAGPLGLAYMLRGSWVASNEDPYATTPGPGRRWVETGPALMILNLRGLTAGNPRELTDPERPFVMWPGTPYEHLMVPVGPTAP